MAALERRSTVTLGTLDVPATAHGGTGAKLRPWRSEPGYVRLKDVMAAEPPEPWVYSPEAVGTAEVRITNPLVRMAAQAYLRPVGEWARPRRRSAFRRALGSCFEFVVQVVGFFRAGRDR